MQFTPKSEEEVQAAQLAPVGLQPFTVLEAAIVFSKSAKNSGKVMMKLKLNVQADDGFDYHIYDYIAPWFMEHKFRHFFFATNHGSDYEAGKVTPEEFVGCEGYCDIGVQKGKDGFPPKNIVRDYSAPEQKPMMTPALIVPATPAKVESEDDVPF